MEKHTSSVTAAVAESASIDTVSLPGVVTATLAGFTRTGVPLVDIPSDPPSTHLAARSCVPLNDVDVGKPVVIAPDVDGPIVIGIIQPTVSKRAVEITADGRSVSVHADENITLKCGDASITLNRDGKVVIRGRHVVTHASGVNRIRGASVEIN